QIQAPRGITGPRRTEENLVPAGFEGKTGSTPLNTDHTQTRYLALSPFVVSGGGSMLSVRPLRLAVLSLLALMLLPAAAVKAAPKMPIGFYDDPSFRWAPEKVIPANLLAAEKAHSSIIHALADWRQIAPTRPKNPLDGDDPAYNLSDMDALVRTAPRYNQQVFITISGTPAWAN